MRATRLPVLMPEALAARSMARVSVVVVEPPSITPLASVVVGCREELVVGACPPEGPLEVVVGVRRTVEDGARPPDPDAVVVDVRLAPDSVPEVAGVDERTLVVEPDDAVVLVDSATVVVDWSTEAVVELGGA